MLAYLTENYVLLHAGSALGFGVGPLLICNQPEYSTMDIESLKLQTSDLSPQTSVLKPQTSDLRIGIPGKYTTANFLLSTAFPEAKNKIEMKFFEIESALLNNQIDLGVIIHENRFTYQDKGLKKIIDLGEYWEDLTHGPIPLGGIMIKRNLPEEIKQKVNRIIRRSVEYAFEHPDSGFDFIRSHSQEMSTEVIKKHIELYVNKFSIDLGELGRKAVETFFKEAHKAGIIPETKQNLFL
jgi:1,4-dihydroxy-6-naphthoate synthase